MKIMVVVLAFTNLKSSMLMVACGGMVWHMGARHVVMYGSVQWCMVACVVTRPLLSISTHGISSKAMLPCFCYPVNNSSHSFLTVVDIIYNHSLFI